MAQRALYPASPHLEFREFIRRIPGSQSFEWIRNNTPEDAYFALGPDYMHRPDEDVTASAPWPCAARWPTT